MTEAAPGTTPAPAAPPANAVEANTVLQGRLADKDWGAKLLSGDAAVTTEYRGLRDLINRPDPADSVAQAMSGADLGFMPNSADVQMRNYAGFLRENGLNDLQVSETLVGREATQAEVDAARLWKQQNLNSKEFAARLMSGEPDARRQLLVANIILTSPLKSA
jgi:hypothetical protein